MFTTSDAATRFLGHSCTTPNLEKDAGSFNDGPVSSPVFKKYLDPVRVYAKHDGETAAPVTGNDKSPKEDYFFSLYQSAKKTIQSAPVATAVSSKEKGVSYLTTSNRDAMELHSPSYPITPPPPPPSEINPPLFRKPSILHMPPTSPNISDLSKSHHHHHHTPPPPPPLRLPGIFSRQRECLTGNCKWLFPLDRCHACRPDDLPYVSGNIPLHQRAFFSNEFLLRQKEKWRRPRTVYTEKQLAALEKAYKKNKYLRGQERKELCKTLSLEERHIKVWYQNRRAKERGQIRHDKWLQRSKRQSANSNNNTTQQKTHDDKTPPKS